MMRLFEVRDRLDGEISQMNSDKKAMMAQIEAEQGDLSSYQRDLANASEAKSTKENELGETQKKLADVQEKKQNMNESKRKFENDLGSFRKDIEDMDMSIQKAEQEKTNRDHTIRNMNDEIAHQDELINKLNKEKKHAMETQAKSSDELTSAEEKMDNLNKIKTKLEVTLDELEDSHDREKKSRLEVDKQRRKVEADLKVCQEKETSRRRMQTLSSASADWKMNKLSWPRPRKQSRSSSQGLRPARRSLRQSGRPDQSLRSSAGLWRGSSTILARGWMRQVEPRPRKLSSIRNARQRSTSLGETWKKLIFNTSQRWQA